VLSNLSEDEGRKARGDVVGVEVVAADVVRENVSAHSYRRYVCCIVILYSILLIRCIQIIVSCVVYIVLVCLFLVCLFVCLFLVCD